MKPLTERTRFYPTPVSANRCIKLRICGEEIVYDEFCNETESSVFIFALARKTRSSNNFDLVQFNGTVPVGIISCFSNLAAGYGEIPLVLGKTTRLAGCRVRSAARRRNCCREFLVLFVERDNHIVCYFISVMSLAW